MKVLAAALVESNISVSKSLLILSLVILSSYGSMSRKNCRRAHSNVWLRQGQQKFGGRNFWPNDIGSPFSVRIV
jgi:hypothetical protein